MEVINIIVNDKLTSIVSVDSFGVLDDENRQASIDLAEDFFIEKCVELKYGTKELRDKYVKSGRFTLENFDDYRDDVMTSIDDGYKEIAMHTVSIIWSSINNIQF